MYAHVPYVLTLEEHLHANVHKVGKLHGNFIWASKILSEQGTSNYPSRCIAVWVLFHKSLIPFESGNSNSNLIGL